MKVARMLQDALKGSVPFVQTTFVPLSVAGRMAGATFNILHICRENIMLDLLSDCPVQVINYEATSPRNPSLKEFMETTDKALWGGLDHNETLPNGPVDAIVSQVNDALKQTGGRRFILGPGCTGLLRVPDAHLTAAKAALSTC